MSNYNPFNQSQTYQPYQATQYFPQPQGSIYMIANSSDIANVPVGAGLSAAICLRDGVMYLKTIQNGSPMILAYRLSTLENTDVPQEQVVQQWSDLDKKITAVLQDYSKRLETIEKQLSSNNGGNPEWPRL